ncbi:hypothetical protein V1460_30465 [Streptomyces sp. SCSIO 30461]|uniref:hypothetical protein n=1 Tax=Streptomyces sp. SCSIO 30461 TaxID=3118085 RepID=UPI0030D420B4
MEKPITPRARPPISKPSRPHLAAALFRRYLHARVQVGPDRTSPPAAARSAVILAETQRVGYRHHH